MGMNLFGIISTHDVLVNNDMDVEFSVEYTDLHYISEQKNDRMNNGSKCK